MTKLIPLDAAIAALTDEADNCDDAVKWGGSRRYVQDCKAAAYAMRSRVPVLQAIPTIDPAAIREAALREAAAEIKLWWASVDDAREPDELILALIGEKK